MKKLNTDLEQAMIRKIEHLFFCENCKRTGVFNNVKLEPEELLDLSLEDIDTSVDFLDMKLPFPSYINAITGGSYISENINRKLALLSREFDIPVMTGSMSVFLKYGELKSYLPLKNTYKVIVNLSARNTVSELLKCAEIMDTKYVCLHVNTAQELIQPEGDNSFKNETKNIKDAVNEFGENLIVKAVGQGFSKGTIKRLCDLGVKNIDISGAGGTDFSEIERMRTVKNFDAFPAIDTETSLSYLKEFDVYKIASGGIYTPLDMIKAIKVGADITASAYYYLMLTKMDKYAAVDKIKNDRLEFKKLMLLLGKKSLKELGGD